MKNKYLFGIIFTSYTFSTMASLEPFAKAESQSGDKILYYYRANKIDPQTGKEIYREGDCFNIFKRKGDHLIERIAIKLMDRTIERRLKTGFSDYKFSAMSMDNNHNIAMLFTNENKHNVLYLKPSNYSDALIIPRSSAYTISGCFKNIVKATCQSSTVSNVTFTEKPEKSEILLKLNFKEDLEFDLEDEDYKEWRSIFIDISRENSYTVLTATSEKTYNRYTLDKGTQIDNPKSRISLNNTFDEELNLALTHF